MKQRKTIIILFSVLVILFVSYKWASRPSATVFSGALKPVVAVQQVQQGPMPTIATALGSLLAIHTANVASEIDGIVAEIFFTEGATVQAGDLLVRLENAPQLATLTQMQAQENLAQVDYSRIKSLFDKGAISRQELDKNDAALKIAQADVAVAQAQFDKTRIRAPFTGVLDARKVSSGEYIVSGQNLVSIVDKSALRLQYALPERYLSQLKVNMPVYFKTNAYPDRSFEGKVNFVSPQVDVATRTIRLEALFENADGLLLPGLSGEVSQVLAENPQALSIPEEAVVPTIDGYQVYVITGEKAEARTVTLGSRIAGKVVVLTGLQPNETVVTRGQDRLREGATVEIISNSPPQPDM